MKLNKRTVITQIKNIGLILLGTFILAVGTEVFINQSSLIMGGMSGVAIILDYIIPSDTSNFELYITILTWGFFLLSLIVLGWDFTAKTLVSAISYPIFIYACSYIIREDVNFLNGFFIIKSEYKEILSCIFGGALVGSGCAIALIGGGSTGGVDIIASILCKYNKKLVEAKIIFLLDATIDIIGMFVIKDLSLSLLGITAAFISATVIEKLFLGPNTSFIAEVITSKPDELNQAVIEKIDRTSTIFKVTGGYSKEEKTMLLISFTMKEYEELRYILKEIDPYAFVLIHKAYEITGEGWTYPSKEIKKHLGETK